MNRHVDIEDLVKGEPPTEEAALTSVPRAFNPQRIPDPEIEEINYLQPNDLPAIHEHAKDGVGLGELAAEHMRTTHHAIARMLAAGLKPPEIARETNSHVQTIYKLQDSPAFQELLVHYQQEADRQAFDLSSKIALLAEESIDALLDSVRDSEAPPSADDLRKIAMGAADRAGYSPVQKTDNRSAVLHLTGQSLDEVKDAVRSAESGRVYQDSFESEAESTDSGAEVGKALPPTGESEPGEARGESEGS